MKKFVSLILTGMMVLSVANITPVIVGAEVVEETVELLNMDFDSMPSTNALALFTEGELTTNGDKRHVPATGEIGANISILANPYTNKEQLTNNADVTVIESGIPGGRTGKVLKYRNAAPTKEGSGEYDDRVHIIGLIAPTTSNAADLLIKGSVMTVEYDVCLESGKKGVIDLMMSTPNMNLSTYQGGDTRLYTSTDNTIYLDANKKGTGTATITAKANEWNKVKAVFDLTGDVQTFRLYFNDTLIKTSTEQYDLLPTAALSYVDKVQDSFKGLSFGGYCTPGATSIYYDNVKVTKIDTDFAFANEYEFNSIDPNKDVMTMKFTTALDADTANNIRLTSEDGLITYDDALTATVDGQKLNVSINAIKGIKAGTYKIHFPATFTDIYGQGLGTVGAETDEVTVVISTDSKGNKVYVSDIAEKYSKTTGVFESNIVVNNISGEDVTVWCAVAAFGEDWSMLGFNQLNQFEMKADVKSVTKEINLNVPEEDRANVKYVRVFVWDGADTMSPYQKVEEITVE